MSSKAQKGGEIGMNGQRYKGGQFLPGSKRTVKGKQATVAHGKQFRARTGLTAPGVLDQIPPGKKAIFGPIKEFVRVEDGVMAITASDHTLSYYGHSRQSLQTLVDLYNTGERLINVPATPEDEA